MDDFPCLVIRGISDYADSHKNRDWQGFAAVAAAAYAKELILQVDDTLAGHNTLATSVDLFGEPGEDDEDNISGPRQQKAPISQAEHHLQALLATDSGYASLDQNRKTGRIGVDLEKSRVETSDDQAIIPENSRVDLPDASLDEDHDQAEDTGSIYTSGPSISSFKHENYISTLVEDLLGGVLPDQDYQEDLQRLQLVLPRLLKTFATKFGRLGSSQMHRNIMIFIRRRRAEIATAFATKFQKHDEAESEDLTVSAHGKMDLQDLMDLWDRNEAKEDYGFDHEAERPEIPGEVEDFATEDIEEELPEIAAYKNLLSNSAAYKWLLGTIQREIQLNPTAPNAQGSIRDEILKNIPIPRVVSRYDAPQICQTTFVLNWDPLGFIMEQEYEKSVEGFLGKIITITGSSCDAQAMTCLQYLQQTWHSYATELLQLVEATIIGEPGSEYACNFPDDTKLVAWMERGSFFLQVTGTDSSTAEIGEQIAWLGSALRSSEEESKLSCYTPFVSEIGVENIQATTADPPIAGYLSCSIDFKLGYHSGFSSNGQCWHHLFRNPTVVIGFPIRRRYQGNTGLEIPLNILAEMAQAYYVDFFDHKLFIKGFSTLLTPVEFNKSQNQIIWHLTCNSNGSRISYLDGPDFHTDGITFADLERSRNILGWCSEASYLAGTIDSTVSIQRSWLRRSSSRYTFGNVQISAGRLITGGDTFLLGTKDLPYRVIRDQYIEKLSWVSKQYIVLWDSGEKRGWLLNGASALLHLLLASLVFNKTDSLGFAFQLNLADIEIPENAMKSSSAMEALLNPNNLSLELYHSKNDETAYPKITPVQIQHRIDNLYNLLEKIMDHQTQIMGKSNPTVNPMPRGNLEGWDFKDLATLEDPLQPRMCKIATRGKSWIDFTRALCAPTLFGTGFGDLIKANDTSQMCPYWSKLPEGKSYLAVSDLDLSQIIDRHGNPNSKPIRLTDRLIWHIQPENDSRVCKCSVYREGSDHSQLAQVILPSHFRKQIANQKHSRIKNWGNGSVVFGYNETMRWSWSDTGFPSLIDALPTDDSDSDSDSDDGFHDTAIGSSMRQSSTFDSIDEKEVSPESEVDALSHDDYEVGIVCALWKELLAVRALFDLTHPEIKKDPNDPNCYCVGRMAKFNVVAAGLPHDEYGMNSATAVTSHLIRTFPKVKFCLVVGIGGGVPSAAKDIRLGDVVVGTGVIQFDMGKRIQDSDFMMTGEKQQTPPYLRAVMTRIQSDCSFSFNSASNPLLNDIKVIGLNRTNYRHPGALQDILFEPDRLHTAGELNCDKCTGTQKRIDRLHSTPQVFYGLIASGNQVVRDAKHRDRLGRENVACFEMEGAGVVRSTADCLVIRGICDYSDSHKNKIWQEYAAATAAAYAKFFLSQMPRNDCDTSVRVPSQLGQPRRPLNLLKQKRPLFSDDYSPSMLDKRQKHSV